MKLLGQLLGEVLVEQGGPELLAREEQIRTLAIKRRRGAPRERAAAAAELTRILDGLTPAQAEPVIRAFAVYFRLINLAEQHHRIRRARSYGRGERATPQRGSLLATLFAARQAGVSAEQARALIGRLEVTLTLTAHPTEAARRTVLEKLYRIARRLEARDECAPGSLMPPDDTETRAAIREEVTTLWQTDEVRRERPSVGDEVKNVLWYVEEILWDVMPEVTRSLQRAFRRAYGEELGAQPLPLRIHAWPGGDMDGNPNVTPEVVQDALRAYRGRGLRRLLAAVRELGGLMSQSSRHLGVPEALRESLEADSQRMPEVAALERAQTEGEPWRRKLRFIEARLLSALEAVERERATARRSEGWSGGPGATGASALGAAGLGASGAPPYRDESELIADLRLCADTLQAAGGPHSGADKVHALVSRVGALGLSIAELELRAPAEDAAAAAAWLLGRGKITPGGERLLETLRRAATAQREFGERACRTLILSMTHKAEELQSALLCARACGLWDAERKVVPLDVVPLFETGEALDHAAAIVGALLADPGYREHLAARGVQEVMVGYSDSSKEAGLLSAAGALRRAQRTLLGLCQEAGVQLRLFHGRGESVARGGGPAQQGILALPRGAVGGAYKATEQGEALDHKYGRPELALRTLELIIGGALLHSLDAQERPDAADEARYGEVFDELAAAGRAAYRALVWEEPRFVEFFSTATPVDEIARLPIGSRPSKRRAGGLETLRAIPWVFAWTQNRAILPGWYGVGSALAQVGGRRGGAALLREMAQRWPFFRAVLDNVQMVLAKTDLEIAGRYAELAPAAARTAVWDRLVEEHKLTLHWVKKALGIKQLLDNNPALQRSIALRNPYVDPMSFLQVSLLGRRRNGDPEWDRALLLSINGIAAGMRNTG
ncbi:MAG: phosphoenolpyruvate carboxylase [Polyangia bacterium]